jgi:hypothetical protein
LSAKNSSNWVNCSLESLCLTIFGFSKAGQPGPLILANFLAALIVCEDIYKELHTVHTYYHQMYSFYTKKESNKFMVLSYLKLAF